MSERFNGNGSGNGRALPVLQKPPAMCAYLNLPGGICRLNAEANAMRSLTTVTFTPEEEAWNNRWGDYAAIPSLARELPPPSYGGRRFACTAAGDSRQQIHCSGYEPKPQTP